MEKNLIKLLNKPRNKIIFSTIVLLVSGAVLGVSLVSVFLNYFPVQTNAQQAQYNPALSYEQAIISAVKNVSPSVVSIVISKNVPIYEQQWINPFGDFAPGIQVPQYVQKGTELQQVGAGSGFIVTEDGLVLTNKHVVLDSSAEYTVFTNDGKKYPAKVLALDPVQDLAVIKIEGSELVFNPLALGNSDEIQIGQTVIAIGNALGQFSNTVSVGVVSGLQRTISASDRSGSFSETLQGIIQTDAAINSGNSGGPLLNLKGEVIGINTAMAEGAQNIGFAIPVNMAKKDIQQVADSGKITYPFLGIRYISVDSGALIAKGPNGEQAVTTGSAADKAGIKEGDVILEINGIKITINNSLASEILKYNPGDKITLKVLRPASPSQGGDGREQDIEATLSQR